ncbi:MAG: HTH-type transcriptional regulator CdhR [Luteibacter sp.]|uniref:GlxA family transcriptional regulator n=1 Tax=Luteibacter sp. TaxID=1886636 RepID=UPI00138290CA|nr:helix-turn-helix domain-containing protein [Luteibacter sp.]KAF1004631.1 MAG: HTH-type transcriptional regulator CdhR [Luteibacter sp.]
MKISVLALDGVFDTGLTALLDTFEMANELARLKGMRVAPFKVSLVGVRKRLRTGLGFSLSVSGAEPDTRPHWVVVPAINAKLPGAVLDTLARRDVIAAGELLRSWHARGAGISAACIGTFLLAEASLLDGREATTTWSLSPMFRQRYPQVSLDHTRMIVPSGKIVTAGSMMGHLDLALWLVRQASPDLAEKVARFMLIDRRASQARYVIPDHLANADPLVAKFDRWARANLARGFSLTEAAKALHVHGRTLQRRTEDVLGKSPLAFFQDLRLERAQELVAEGMRMDAVANEVGYSNTGTLRNLLRRKLGTGVKQLRSSGRAGD